MSLAPTLSTLSSNHCLKLSWDAFSPLLSNLLSQKHSWPLCVCVCVFVCLCVCVNVLQLHTLSPGLWAPSVDGPPPGKGAPASYLEETRQWRKTHKRDVWRKPWCRGSARTEDHRPPQVCRCSNIIKQLKWKNPKKTWLVYYFNNKKKRKR